MKQIYEWVWTGLSLFLSTGFFSEHKLSFHSDPRFSFCGQEHKSTFSCHLEEVNNSE